MKNSLVDEIKDSEHLTCVIVVPTCVIGIVCIFLMYYAYSLLYLILSPVK